ncbi:cell cycle checkpoint control protein RAD9A isoform X1 [Cucumis melo var. makuwa]|uniref:Cell cycle checkpoint control protein RAD9A isoform X1 n=1 Tax=Cucumis melo var. makuwa TaxID=1194695 RepID=A0A5D3CQZ5_CUCMM|nr:cell cycle checkpoint control protein RAD9A isoform X1 [Cucumis melo var. makuwa]
MEFSLSGNALKTFARSVTCLARIGNELVIQASPSQVTYACRTWSLLAFYTLNASRSAYLAITFETGFFDNYAISGNQVQCSVLLKAVCSVLRTPIASIDHLKVQLPDPDALKVRWSLECFNGMKKTYFISCNIEPDIQHLSLDRRQFPSELVVRPRDLNRLLSNFQSSLQEITVIATEPTSLPSEAASEIEGKAVELRSYIDPTKDNDTLLHTQLWIDPMEEFVHYSHSGDPVDITFGVKELKAFLSFCEGCEVDIHLYFEKAGEPILMAPKFGLDDGSSSNFDATLVLATMLISQLHVGDRSQPPQEAASVHGESDRRAGSQAQAQAQQDASRPNVSGHPSDHTRIWSDLSGSAPRSGNGAEGQVQGERNLSSSEQMEIQRIGTIQISKAGCAQENDRVGRARYPLQCNLFPISISFEVIFGYDSYMMMSVTVLMNFAPIRKVTILWEGIREENVKVSSRYLISHLLNLAYLVTPAASSNIFLFGCIMLSEKSDINGPPVSQHHPSNWVDEEDDDDDDGDDNELCVQSTPPYYEEQ